MSGVVHFKFKSAISFDSVQFDGAFVTVGELKNLIAEKKGLGREATVELVLSDPRSHAEYSDDAHLLPKSTSVLVRRAPVSKLRALEGSTVEAGVTSISAAASASERPSATQRPQQPSQQQFPAFRLAPQDDFGGDLYAQQQQPSSSNTAGPGGAEEDALASRLAQQGASWQKEVAAGARGRGRGRGRGGRGVIAIPPPNYVCFRCNQGGHYIGDCPTNGDPEYDRKRIRQPVGIPLSRLAINSEGGLVLPGGHTGSLVPNEDVFQREMFGTPAQPKAEQPKLADQPKPALPQPASSQPAASAPLLLDNKPHADDAPGQEVVVYQAPEAAPTLAGDDQLFLALAQPLAPAKPPAKPEKAAAAKGPAAPGNPWLPPLPMPLMPPGVAAAPPFMAAFTPNLGGPLSKEAFEALRVAARREHRAGSSESSRSRSRSPRRPRRRSRSRSASAERDGGSRQRRRTDRGARRSRFGDKGRADASESPARNDERPSWRERGSRSRKDAADGPSRSVDGRHAKRRRTQQAAPERRTLDTPHVDDAPPDERFGAAMDRWEPGSDFESKSVARLQRGRKAGGGVNSTAQHPAAQPLMEASGARKPGPSPADAGAEAAVSGPAAPDGVADSGVPEQQGQQHTVEPIALLEELDQAPHIDFSSRAVLEQAAQSEEVKKKGRDKEEKDKKHKKHKKHHRKEKKHHKKDVADAPDRELSDGSGEDEGNKAVSQVESEMPRAAALTGLVPNPRLFQLSHSAATSSLRANPRQADRGRRNR